METLELNEKNLIEAWHSDRRMVDLEKEFGVVKETIHNHWRKLKDQGKLPDINRNAKNGGVRKALQEALDLVDPIFGEMRPAAIEVDLLLAKLIEVHGHEKR